MCNLRQTVCNGKCVFNFGIIYCSVYMSVSLVKCPFLGLLFCFCCSSLYRDIIIFIFIFIFTIIIIIVYIFWTLNSSGCNRSNFLWGINQVFLTLISHFPVVMDRLIMRRTSWKASSTASRLCDPRSSGHSQMRTLYSQLSESAGLTSSGWWVQTSSIWVHRGDTQHVLSGLVVFRDTVFKSKNVIMKKRKIMKLIIIVSAFHGSTVCLLSSVLILELCSALSKKWKTEAHMPVGHLAKQRSREPLKGDEQKSRVKSRFPRKEDPWNSFNNY